MTAKKRINPLQRPTTDATKAKLPKPRTRRPSITNAEFLRDGKPGTGAQIPCMDWPADSLPSGEAHYIPPDAAPFPWPVRVLNWLDNAQFWTRQRVANGLRRIAARVAP